MDELRVGKGNSTRQKEISRWTCGLMYYSDIKNVKSHTQSPITLPDVENNNHEQMRYGALKEEHQMDSD
ncbi:hypothetical protein JTE90_027791 [Oedothorax gibbosus]|uniref:Uncharacterized protein n=1 Tax=Oedothorax gibbosus TaxID=931172 RepID=A0AAV6V8F0_9ARAC|nr:hypothetical protein JTE90_027791 [Oedothorax gibbosus]